MRAVLACLSLAALVGCAALQPVEVVRVDGLSELSISRGGIGGELALVINNPNPVAIAAESVDVELAISGTPVGQVQLPYAQSIPKGPNQVLRLSVQAETAALLSVLEANLFRFLAGEEVEVSVKGEVKGSALGIAVGIPVDSKQNMKIQL
ncbi:MAG: LEA type 2 family protein [Flavobacteriales bacterium]